MVKYSERNSGLISSLNKNNENYFCNFDFELLGILVTRLDTIWNSGFTEAYKQTIMSTQPNGEHTSMCCLS